MRNGGIFRDSWGHPRIVWCIALVVTVLVSIVALLVFGLNEVDMAVQKNDCIGFGQSSGRHVEWSRHGLFSYYCLTPANDGKMIPIENLTNLTSKGD